MKRGTIQHNLAILSVVVLLFVFSCVPFHILAVGEGNYYGPLELQIQERTGTGSNSRNRFIKTPANSITVFAKTVQGGYSRLLQYTFSQSDISNLCFWKESGGGSTVTDWALDGVNKTINVDGVTWYVHYANFNSNYGSIISDIVRVHTFSSNASASSYYSDASCITMFNLTDYASGIVPPVVNYGDLVDVRFTTNFTNSQQFDYTQMRYNKDTIYWDRFEDSNGNALNDPNLRVEIQAYMTEYEGLSKIDLLDNTILDMVNVGQPVTLYKGSAHIGEKSFTWQQVAEAFTGQSQMLTFFQKLVPHVYDNSWITNGWVYRIRLTTVDESYSSEWQIVYNVTSSPPSDAETIYNYYYYYGGQGIDPGVVNSIQNIQYINQDSNNVTSNYYVNGVEIPTGGSNWLETLLKFISDTIGKILDFLGSLFDGFIDLLLGLFDSFDPVGSFFNWWESLKDQFNGIDLTLPEYNLPEEDISSLSNLPKKTLDIFINNGLGFIIFVPLIILILRLFL